VWRFVIAGFLVAHGLVHLAVWATPKNPNQPQPFDPKHSWLLGDTAAAHTMAVWLAATACLVFVGAGLGLFFHLELWHALTIAGAAVGLVVAGLYFNAWLSFDVGLNAALLVALVATNWPSASLVGT
jgi:hypothetical protein